MNKIKREKGQTMIYKILHRTLKIEQHEPHKKIYYSGNVGIRLKRRTNDGW